VGDRVRVKICGLVRREDVLAADRAGADYLGTVLTSGFGRSVDPERARPLFEGTAARRVAVLVDEAPNDAATAARAIGASVVQLHGEEDPGVLRALRERGPWILWKAVRARSLDDLERAVGRYGDLADGILVEGWKEGSRGGAGARVSLDPDRVRAVLPRELDFILAGGLGPASVADSVRRFRPDVVDVSSGVEQKLGEKDVGLVQSFVREAKGAAPTDVRGARAAGASG
jgi:phosphoribosylanthranilate isomerase